MKTFYKNFSREHKRESESTAFHNSKGGSFSDAARRAATKLGKPEASVTHPFCEWTIRLKCAREWIITIML